MKIRILILAFIVLSANTVNAGWYIINSETNRAIAIANYEPSRTDLETRNEFAVSSNLEISINEAEYFNGKIRKRAKSQDEKNAEQLALEEQDEMAKIYHLMFREAYKEAIKEGYTFKHAGKHVDDKSGTEAEAITEKEIMDELKKNK